MKIPRFEPGIHIYDLGNLDMRAILGTLSAPLVVLVVLVMLAIMQGAQGCTLTTVLVLPF